jgi:hypothetical protein
VRCYYAYTPPLRLGLRLAHILRTVQICKQKYLAASVRFRLYCTKRVYTHTLFSGLITFISFVRGNRKLPVFADMKDLSTQKASLTFGFINGLHMSEVDVKDECTANKRKKIYQVNVIKK